MIGRRTGREDAQLVHELFPCGNRQVSLGGGGCEPPSPDKYCLPWNYVCHVCPFARFISHRPSSFTFRPSFNWSWLTATERVKTQMLLQCSFVLRSSAPFDPGRIGSGEEERTEFPGSIIPRPWRKRVPLNGGSGKGREIELHHGKIFSLARRGNRLSFVERTRIGCAGGPLRIRYDDAATT